MCGDVLRFLNRLIKRAGVRACPASAFIRALSSVNGHVKLGPRVICSPVGVSELAPG